MNQEKPSYSDRPSWLNQMGSFTAMAILILMPFFLPDLARLQIALNILIASLIMVAIIYNRYIWDFRINDGKVQSRHGIITSIKHRSINLSDISDIQVKQTVIQRLFDVGDVEFSTADDSEANMVFVGIKAPLAFKDKVLQQQSQKKVGASKKG